MEEVSQKPYSPSKIEHDSAFHRVIKTRKRSYFIDLQSTYDDEVFVSVTESKKCYNPDGSIYFERHKIFLFEEDFKVILQGITSMMDIVISRDYDLSKIFKRDNTTQENKRPPIFIKKRQKINSDENFTSPVDDSNISFESLELEDVSSTH